MEIIRKEHSFALSFTHLTIGDRGVVELQIRARSLTRWRVRLLSASGLLLEALPLVQLLACSLTAGRKLTSTSLNAANRAFQSFDFGASTFACRKKHGAVTTRYRLKLRLTICALNQLTFFNFNVNVKVH